MNENGETAGVALVAVPAWIPRVAGDVGRPVRVVLEPVVDGLAIAEDAAADEAEWLEPG